MTVLNGAATLISDRPFKIGDWIAVGETQGLVEDVAFRATQVRTFEDGLVTIPNYGTQHQMIRSN